MRDPQEKHPIDEQFQQAFGQLPANPAPNGWDSPSAKVWEQIQQEIKPRQHPLWNTRSWILLAFVSIALGVWWWNRPAQIPIQTPVQQPVTPTETPVAAPVENPAPATSTPETPATAKEAPIKPAPVNKVNTTNTIDAVNSKEAESGAKAPSPRNSKSEALPGSKSSARNTTEQKVGN